MIVKLLFFYILFIQIIPLSIAQTNKSNLKRYDTIAVIGKKFIDFNELNRSFELYPVWHGQDTFKEAYTKQLNNLIEEKLFASEAERINFKNDSVLSDYLRFINEKEIIKELYKKEIASKIKINDSEYNEAYSRSKKKVTFNVIFTPDSLAANIYKSEIRNKNFGKIELRDSMIEFKGTVRDAKYGELVEGFENIVFNLFPKEIYGPVKFRKGFILIELLNFAEEKFKSGYELAEQKSKLQKVISDRKSDTISSAFIVNLMKDKNLKINIPVMQELSKYCSSSFSEKLIDKLNILPTVYVRDSEIKKVRGDTRILSKEILATYKGGKLTVSDFLFKLSSMPGRFRPRLKSIRNIMDAIAVMVRNDFLVKLGLKENLNKNSSVQRETAIQTDEILAAYFFEKEKEKIEIRKDLINDFKQTSPLAKKYGENLNDQIVEELIKINSIKSKYLNNLKEKFPIKIDTALILSLIPNPQEVIRHKPIDFRVKEIFQ